MNTQQRFTDYTKKIREALPTWMEMRKNDKSIGAKFLSSIGLRLDDMNWYLDYAMKQLYIETADIHQVSTLYRAEVPKNILITGNYRLFTDLYEATEETSLKKFMEAKKDEGDYGSLLSNTSYYVDRESGVIYFTHPVSSSEKYTHGQFDISIIEENGSEILRETIPLEMHQVWNFFDEFGLMLGVPRLHGEENDVYKARILNVFKRPSSSTKEGLINGIARELGLIKKKKWDNTKEELILSEERIVTTSILVDGWYEPHHYIDSSGRMVLLPVDSIESPAEIEYIIGISLHELHDRNDKEFQRELYTSDGSPTPKLESYANILQSQIPIHWGQWKWDEGFWQEGFDMEMSFLPTSYDASIAGWITNTREGVS